MPGMKRVDEKEVEVEVEVEDDEWQAAEDARDPAGERAGSPAPALTGGTQRRAGSSGAAPGAGSG